MDYLLEDKQKNKSKVSAWVMDYDKNTNSNMNKGKKELMLNSRSDYSELKQKYANTQLKNISINFGFPSRKSYKYKNSLLAFYLVQENRRFIGESCKTDKTYIKEADFGNGNKIVEDSGKSIRQAALEIQTFMIVNYPNKIIFEEIIPLLIECLLDTEDYLQQIVIMTWLNWLK